jgi:hypothetical protein
VARKGKLDDESVYRAIFIYFTDYPDEFVFSYIDT